MHAVVNRTDEPTTGPDSTGHYTRYLVINRNREECEKEACTGVSESLYCTAEADRTVSRSSVHLPVN